MNTSGKPAASSTATVAVVDRDSPPCCPRVASDRMNTPSSSRVALHPHPIAQQRAARERAGRIDGHDRHPLAAAARHAHQRVDQRRLADARRPGHADHERPPAVGVDRAQRRPRARQVVVERAHQRRRRDQVARDDLRDLLLGTAPHAASRRFAGRGQRLRSSASCLQAASAAWRRSSRAMTIFWTSLVPSPISASFASRR